MIEDERNLEDIVIQFLQAEGWADTREILLTFPELMSNEAQEIFEEILKCLRMEDDPDGEQIIRERGILLRRCRDIGVNQAIQEKTGSLDSLTYVLKELNRPTSPNDIPRHIQLCQQALQLLPKKENPPLWAAIQVELGNSLSQNPSGDRANNIETAIRHFQNALQVLNKNDFPEPWGLTQSNLADAYTNRIKGVRAESIETAIMYCRNALQVLNRHDFPDSWAKTQNNLANAYMNRIKGNRAENIETAIGYFENSLQIRKYHDFEWGIIHNNLANAYQDRIKGNRAENIELAIGHFQSALQVLNRQDFPEHWALTQNNLANAYKARIKGDRAENLEKAIEYCQNALQIRTINEFPMGWAMTKSNLANAYRDRIKGNRAENIELAIGHFQSALQVLNRQDFPEHWALIQNNLANAYKARIKGDRAENLEKAIEYCQNALKIYTIQDFPEHWATIQNTLAMVFRRRTQGDRAENIEMAIEHCQNALKINTIQDFPEHWASTQTCLANAYMNRIMGDRAENIEMAIRHYQSDLEISTLRDFPEDWAMTQNNLANAYTNRIMGDRAENIEMAIKHCQNALQVLKHQDFPEHWALIQNNLAYAYSNRIEGDRAENMEMAIEHCENALQLRTREAFPEQWAITQNNLANAYISRIKGDRAENIEQSIKHYQNALQIFKTKTYPVRCRDTALKLISLLFPANRWNEAAEPYLWAIEAVNTLYRSSLFQNSKERELKEIGDLYRQAGYALARAGRLQEAAVALERGRARRLGEGLARDRADLGKVKELDPEAFQRFQQASAQVHYLETAEAKADTVLEDESKDREAQRNEASLAQKELEEAVSCIQRIPGYEKFLTEPDWAELAEAAANQPLIYLVTTPAGSLVLELRCDDSSGPTVEPIWQDDFKEKDLLEILQIWFQAYDRLLSDYRLFLHAVCPATKILWDKLMCGVVVHLEDKGFREAILIPTGLLVLMPLHATWNEENGRRIYALDRLTFSYVPSARALNHSRKIADISKALHLLAIDNPWPVKARSLKHSEKEVSALEAFFPSKENLSREKATKEAVKNSLPKADVVHFSCHGSADWTDPEESNLLMAGDQKLTVRDLFALQLPGARMAALSACESGIPGGDLPDEVISLPSAFLRAGFAGVVGSMWTVEEKSTSELMINFYKLWLGKDEKVKDALPPAEALRESQRRVRSQGIFEHPFYWAAFYLTGV